jgi:hypothetical protein
MDQVFKFRMQVQIAEALGPVNRWFCSQFHGQSIEDPEVLWRYFVDSEGADDFAKRFAEAMSGENRWFCSQYYHREVRELPVLWDYYMLMREIDDGDQGIAC